MVAAGSIVSYAPGIVVEARTVSMVLYAKDTEVYITSLELANDPVCLLYFAA